MANFCCTQEVLSKCLLTIASASRSQSIASIAGKRCGVAASCGSAKFPSRRSAAAALPQRNTTCNRNQTVARAAGDRPRPQTARLLPLQTRLGFRFAKLRFPLQLGSVELAHCQQRWREVPRKSVDHQSLLSAKPVKSEQLNSRPGRRRWRVEIHETGQLNPQLSSAAEIFSKKIARPVARAGHRGSRDSMVAMLNPARTTPLRSWPDLPQRPSRRPPPRVPDGPRI